jgi:hypothetical protein
VSKKSVGATPKAHERALENPAFIPNYPTRAGTVKPSAMKSADMQMQQSDYNR